MFAVQPHVLSQTLGVLYRADQPDTGRGTLSRPVGSRKLKEIGEGTRCDDLHHLHLFQGQQQVVHEHTSA